MITAKEAAEKAEYILHNALTTELKDIERCIMEEVEEGRKSCSFDGSISKETREELERLGYKVKTGSQYNESYVIISW